MSTPDGQCEACLFPGVPLELRPVRRGVDPPARLCRLCRETASGLTVTHPNNERTIDDVLQAIAYVGNAVIEAINARRDTP
jgi:hypothetical protein